MVWFWSDRVKRFYKKICFKAPRKSPKEKWLNEPTEFNYAKKRGRARKTNRYGPVAA